MQIANVKQRQIWFPRVGNQIWVRTPQNLASERVYSRNCCSLKCKHIFGFYYKQILGLSKFLDPLFQVRRGCKPRLPGLGGPKSG